MGEGGKGEGIKAVKRSIWSEKRTMKRERVMERVKDRMMKR